MIVNLALSFKKRFLIYISVKNSNRRHYRVYNKYSTKLKGQQNKPTMLFEFTLNLLEICSCTKYSIEIYVVFTLVCITSRQKTRTKKSPSKK